MTARGETGGGGGGGGGSASKRVEKGMAGRERRRRRPLSRTAGSLCVRRWRPGIQTSEERRSKQTNPFWRSARGVDGRAGLLRPREGGGSKEEERAAASTRRRPPWFEGWLAPPLAARPIPGTTSAMHKPRVRPCDSPSYAAGRPRLGVPCSRGVRFLSSRKPTTDCKKKLGGQIHLVRHQGLCIPSAIPGTTDSPKSVLCFVESCGGLL